VKPAGLDGLANECLLVGRQTYFHAPKRKRLRMRSKCQAFPRRETRAPIEMKLDADIFRLALIRICNALTADRLDRVVTTRHQRDRNGSNGWAFKPELGYSRRLGHWALDGSGATWFFTTNPEFWSHNQFFPGRRSQSQAPIGAFEAHVKLRRQAPAMGVAQRQ
jgi:hypothetical protein